MEEDTKHNSPTDRACEETFSEVFAKETSAAPDDHDIFAGDAALYRALRQPSARWGLQSGKTPGLPLLHIFLAANMLLVTVLLCYLVFRPQPTHTTTHQPHPLPQPAAIHTPSPGPTATANARPPVPAGAPATLPDKQPLSWKTGETLYYSGNYQQAFHVFALLADRLPASSDASEAFRDYLQLLQAQCIENLSDGRQSGPFFTTALQSRAPLVRAVADYQLALIENRNRQFFEVRRRAYRTVALVRAFENRLPQNLEADAYFMAAEAITRQVLLLNNHSDRLPGRLWSDSLRAEVMHPMEHQDLNALLQTGLAEFAAHSVEPSVDRHEHFDLGLQWSAVAMDAPLEEVLARIASAAGMNLSWAADDDIRKTPVTMCISNASEQFVAEVAAGSAGAIARFDGANIFINDTRQYASLDEYKTLLTSEAIAVWRRFTLRYRGDHRIPNAHYAMGLMLDCAGQTGTALGEYKLVVGRYPNNPLAPFALLNASILKTSMRDHAGARQDLTDLVVQYPDSRIIGAASLHLADATMTLGLHDEAVKIYRRLYNLDPGKHSQREAAYGLGRCYFETKQYEEAAKWFNTAVELTENARDRRLREASFMLGQACIKLQRFPEAARALANAVSDTQSNEEFVKVMLELVKAEVGRHDYVAALNILDNIQSSDSLDQEQSSAVLRARARIYIDIDLVDTAAALLRRKIQFVADSRLRAQLGLELARCYAAAGDLRLARKEVAEALANLPSGDERQQAQLLLADVCMRLEQYDQSIEACLDLLATGVHDKAISDRAREIMGLCYTALKQYERAALAYAGVNNNVIEEKKQ